MIQVSRFGTGGINNVKRLGGAAGLGNVAFMPLEHGEAYELMREIKNLLGPNGILNPGKIFAVLSFHHRDT